MRWIIVGIIGFGLGYWVCTLLVPHATPIPQCMPADTSPSKLIVAMTITEDQNASDKESGARLQFSCPEIALPNYVSFSQGETVTCSTDGNIPLGFISSKLAYATRVGPTNAIRMYSCAYHWKSGSTSIDVPKGTQLSPVYKPGGTFQVSYAPNNPQILQNCSVVVVAKDGTQILTGPILKDNGNYSTPNINTSGLRGQGTIVMTRTCSLQMNFSPAPFFQATVTYVSTATLAVNWNPTDP
jgi:hypothetical protein